MDHIADLVDIRLHRHGGVDHQHHGGAEGISAGVDYRGRGLGDCAIAGVDGRDVEQLHRLAVFVEALFGIEDRQQVELVLRHGAGGRFQGQDLAVVVAVVLRLGQHAFGGGGIGQQLFHFAGLTQEHHRRPAGAFGELEHQALLPVADLGGRQPTAAAPIGGGADAHPRAAVDVLALIHVEHRKRRQGFARCAAGSAGEFRAGLAEHALEQGFLAHHQQGSLTTVHVGDHYRRRDLGHYSSRRLGRRIATAQPPVTGATNGQRNRHRHGGQRQHRPTALLGHGSVWWRCHHRLAHGLWLGFIGGNVDGDGRHARQVKTQRNRQRPHQRGVRRLCRQLIQRQQQRRRIRETLIRVLGQQLAQHLLITPVMQRQLRQRLGQVGQRRGERISAVIRQLADEDLVKHHA